MDCHRLEVSQDYGAKTLKALSQTEQKELEQAMCLDREPEARTTEGCPLFVTLKLQPFCDTSVAIGEGR